jgi:hypothetical protein
MGLPEDEESFAVLIKDVAFRVDNDDVSSEQLRRGFLQMDLARVNRELRRAEEGGDFDAQRRLAHERQTLRDQIGELMRVTL